jgi:ribosomal protein L20A (L18A)
MKFDISGSLQLGRLKHKFEKSVEAQSERLAKDAILKEFGGRYNLSRSKIEIKEIKKAEGK